LLDLAHVLSTRELRRAYEQAQILHLLRDADLGALLDRSPGRRGAPALRALIEEPSLTRSEAEARLLDLLRAADLPPTATNARVGCHEVDFLWHPQRLVVEVDGFAYHASRAAFERDRLRDAELQADGYRVIRITWRQIDEKPEAVIARLARVLARP
jgi:very-short-patch-repair endonuclease